MKLDETLTRFLKEIQEEVFKEFGISLSSEQIHDIIETQIEATKLGISKGITVHWIRFGKFVFTDKCNTIKELKVLDQRLEDNEDLLPHEKLELRKSKIIEKANNRDTLLKNSTLRDTTPISAEVLINTPNMYKVKLPTFTALTNKFNKK